MLNHNNANKYSIKLVFCCDYEAKIVDNITSPAFNSRYEQ